MNDTKKAEQDVQQYAAEVAQKFYPDDRSKREEFQKSLGNWGDEVVTDFNKGEAENDE